MGKIFFCGDPHGRFDHIVAAAREHDPVAIILLGDLEAQRPLHDELEEFADRVWLIHGNHDTDNAIIWQNLWGSSLASRNVHGQVVELPNGLRLAGLGGVFRSMVWNPSLCGLRMGVPQHISPEFHGRVTPPKDRFNGRQPLRHWSSIYPSTMDRLSELRADILITHEAPSYHLGGYRAIDELARRMGVKIAVHGHHHDSQDSSALWSRQGFKSFGVAMRGISVIDVEGQSFTVKPGEEDKHVHQVFDPTCTQETDSAPAELSST